MSGRIIYKKIITLQRFSQVSPLFGHLAAEYNKQNI